MHSLEVISYRHPDSNIKAIAKTLYSAMVHNLHLEPESLARFSQRLSEDRIANPHSRIMTMNNDIRAALDSWLPLIKELSFDERVGFITMVIAYNKTIRAQKDGPLTPHPKLALAALFTSYRDNVKSALTELQNEALRANAQLPNIHKTHTITAAQSMSAIPRTAETLRAYLAKAVERLKTDPKAIKTVTKLAKELERITT